jgi:DNA-binding response OmpR family regulator
MGKPYGMDYPDLLILDLTLPGASGIQVLREFRKHPDCANTPVIVVTHSKAQSDWKSVSDLGVSQYFEKPRTLKEYMELGRIILDIAQVRTV